MWSKSGTPQSRREGQLRSTWVAASIAVCAGSAGAAPARVVVTEKPGHITQATITVDASPVEVYRIASDYKRWPTLLADVTSVTIERGGRRDARVKFRSKALGRVVAIQLDNESDRAIRFRGVGGPPGTRAYGEYRFEALADGRTFVTATFMLHAGGLSSLVISERSIERMRRAKLESDLAAIQRWFAR